MVCVCFITSNKHTLGPNSLKQCDLWWNEISRPDRAGLCCFFHLIYAMWQQRCIRGKRSNIDRSLPLSRGPDLSLFSTYRYNTFGPTCCIYQTRGESQFVQFFERCNSYLIGNACSYITFILSVNVIEIEIFSASETSVQQVSGRINQKSIGDINWRSMMDSIGSTVAVNQMLNIMQTADHHCFQNPHRSMKQQPPTYTLIAWT